MKANVLLPCCFLLSMALANRAGAPIREAAMQAGALAFVAKENLVQIGTVISGPQQSFSR